MRTHSVDEIIRVTGSAQQPIRSDFIIWDSKVTVDSPAIATAYAALQADGAKVNAYLTGKGIPGSEISTAAIATKTLYAPIPGDNSSPQAEMDSAGSVGTFRKVAGYQLSETFEVRSINIDLVDNVSRQSTQLINSGVHFESKPPEYLYTKLSDLKVQMLAAAAKDARSRAEQIAASSGCRLGDIRFSRMGVLQIEPLYTADNSNSNAISDTGTNDTSSLDKKIIAVVTAGYAIR